MADQTPQERAAALRTYAKQQGVLARKYRAGKGVLYYRIEKRPQGDVKIAIDGRLLPDGERERQNREFARKAEQARADANREATDLESQ